MIEPMKRALLVAAVLFMVLPAVAAVVPDAAFAQASPQESACVGAGGNWTGSECDMPGDGSLDGLFETITNALLFLVGAVSVIMLIVGGFKYVVSGGDSSKIESAKNTIIYAIVGIVVAVLAYAAVDFVIDQLD